MDKLTMSVETGSTSRKVDYKGIKIGAYLIGFGLFLIFVYITIGLCTDKITFDKLTDSLSGIILFFGYLSLSIGYSAFVLLIKKNK